MGREQGDERKFRVGKPRTAAERYYNPIGKDNSL